MREILFRGKRTSDGKWVEGYYAQLHFQNQHWIFDGSVYLNNGSPCRYPVDPETIGQYTGLKDKNGEKIFEGDIVRYNDTAHRVVFEQRNGTAYFGIVMYPDETWSFGYSVPADRMEVIGNIYDNPELLEVKQ